MHNKLIVACVAIAASAASALTPAASASPVLTHEGKSVPVGTLFMATNTGAISFTGAGGFLYRCDVANLTGKVIKNSGTVIEEEIASFDFHGTAASGECTSNYFGAPLRVTMGKLCMKVSASPADAIVITGCGASATFTWNVTGVASCKYSRASLNATFTTGSAPVTLSEQEFVRVEGEGIVCPLGFKVDLSFDLWTDVEGIEVGVPLVIS